MIQNQASLRASRRQVLPRAIWPAVAAVVLGVLCFLPGTVCAAEAAPVPAQVRPIPFSQIVTFLFLMLGPIKIIGPFSKATQAADAKLTHQIAFRAIFFAILALLLAALLGESVLTQFSVPLPVLAISGGIILFLVALQQVLQQFAPPAKSDRAATPPTPSVALTPIAIPTIVTPYGIAALIIFIVLSPDLKRQLAIVAVLLGIMLLNLIVMLVARRILRFIGVFLQILGAVLGIIQVALGLQIILFNLKRVWM